jgi:hypothetical protein
VLLLPAKDNYHNTVITALEKAEWQITKEQYTLHIGKRHLWIDIEAQHITDAISILVEVKGFENMRSSVNYLANVLGKYVLYQAVLESLKINNPLYLAVTNKAYNGILREPIGRQALQKVNAKLLIFDPVVEEIVQWIH